MRADRLREFIGVSHNNFFIYVSLSQCRFEQTLIDRRLFHLDSHRNNLSEDSGLLEIPLHH